MKGFNEIGTFKPDNIIAGNNIPLLTKSIELDLGTGTLVRGSVISVSGKIASRTVTGTEPNTTIIYDKVDGILTDDITLNANNKTNATIYITGEFNSNYLLTGEGTTVSNFERELRTLGIYIK